MLGEVCLVNGNGKRFWGVRELDGGVNNAAVILFAAAGGKDIHSVRKFEHCVVVDSAGERRCVINCLGFFFLFAEFILFRNIRGDCVGKCGEFGCLFGLQRGFNGNQAVKHRCVAKRFNDCTHLLAACGSPASVLNKSNGAVLQAVRSKVVQEGFHRYKYAGIIGRRSKNNVTEAETCGDYIGRRGDGNIVNDRADAAVKKIRGNHFSRICGVAIYGSVSNNNAAFFGRVAAPKQVFANKTVEIPAPDKTVQRAYERDFDSGCFFEQRLNLCAVFADDVGIVTAGFIHIVAVKIHFIGKNCTVQCTECAECIRRKQDFINGVVCDHNFRPMYHGCGNEGQVMPAG